MHRRVDQDHVLVGLHPSPDGARPAIRGAVVDDPEDAIGRAVGLALHHLGHQPPERLDAGLRLTIAGGPSLWPGPDGIGMESPEGRGIGEQRLIVQEQGQLGALTELRPEGTTTCEGLGLGQEVGRKLGAITRRRSGQGANPVIAISCLVRRSCI